MMASYLEQLAAEEGLSDVERLVLRQADVRTAEDAHSLLSAFPSLADVGVRTHVLSSAAAASIGGAYAQLAASSQPPPDFAFGAEPPPFASTPLGMAVGVAPINAAAPPPRPNCDLRLAAWPVKDQGRRGSCVAFGATACVEHHQTLSRGPGSEQMLYWAIKDHSGDPKKSTDGTWLQYARDMLAADGICTDLACPYDGRPQHPVCGPRPSGAAIQDAARHTSAASVYQRKPSNAAGTVLKCLQAGRPVAITLPVFRDPALPRGRTNWTTPVGVAYGRVLGPPPMSIVEGGHCVCVTGFVSDVTEPNGGYFIVRNSWGTKWAHAAPSPGSSLSPEVGYGELPATYVETYCWELLQL